MGFISLCVLAVWTKPSPTFSHCVSEEHHTHPRLSESETISLAKYFQRPAPLCSAPLCAEYCSHAVSLSVCVMFSSDFVTVTLSLRFGDVTVTARDFTFYDCTAVKQLSGSMPWVTTDELSSLLSCLLRLTHCITADIIIKSLISLSETLTLHQFTLHLSLMSVTFSSCSLALIVLSKPVTLYFKLSYNPAQVLSCPYIPTYISTTYVCEGCRHLTPALHSFSIVFPSLHMFIIWLNCAP